MELHKIIIGMLLMILVVTGLVYFFSGVVSTYSDNTGDYDNSSLNELVDKFDNLTNHTKQLNNELTTLQSENEEDDGVNFISAVDTFLTQGYYAIIIGAKSGELMIEMVDVGAEETAEITGGFSNYIKYVLIAIIIVIFSIGILAAVLLTKAPRL